MMSVYYNKNHELYNQWVALTDTYDKGDKGIQGYAKVSVAVLGPGDKLAVRSLVCRITTRVCCRLNYICSQRQGCATGP